MIKILMNNQKLKEVYDIAEREKRTLLGVIYNDYVTPQLLTEETLDSRKVYANRSLILKIMELERKLNTEDLNIMYLQYGPSTNFQMKLQEDELLVGT